MQWLRLLRGIRKRKRKSRNTEYSAIARKNFWKKILVEAESHPLRNVVFFLGVQLGYEIQQTRAG